MTSRAPTTGTGTLTADALPAAATKPLPLRGCLRRPPTERELIATEIFERLHPVMGALGLLFVAVVLAQVAAHGTLHTALSVTTWCLWAMFVVEYGLRMVIAPSTVRFLRSTWWQLLFLAVPFLNAVRFLVFLRAARPARVVAAAFRAGRSARATLASRLGWLALVTTIVIFAAADLLYEVADMRPYGIALHDAAKAALVGEAIRSQHGVAQLLDVVLAVYAVAVFATLAASAGSYFLERRTEDRDVAGAHALDLTR